MIAAELEHIQLMTSILLHKLSQAPWKWIGGAILAGLGASSVFAGTAGFYLGIIEPPMVHFVGEKHKTPYVVRTAFTYKDGKWSIAPNSASAADVQKRWTLALPKQIHWTIGFDGKKVGQFTSSTPQKQSQYSSDTQIQQPDPGKPVALIKAPKDSFVYWNFTPSFRPLVCTSSTYVDDPDRWKAKKSGSANKPSAELLAAFRKADPDNATLNADRIKIAKTYESAHGGLLISLIRIDPGKKEEDYGPGEGPEPFWFYINGQDIKLIGKSLELIDAGDYDHDGHSEVVFHKSDYDYDGYILVYNDMGKQIEFGWSYH